MEKIIIDFFDKNGRLINSYPMTTNLGAEEALNLAKQHLVDDGLVSTKDLEELKFCIRNK